MRTSFSRSLTPAATTVVASVAVSVLLASGQAMAAAAPAPGADGQAARAAAVVEAATGTGGVASVPAGLAPATSTGSVGMGAADGSSLGMALPSSRTTAGVRAGNGSVVYPGAVKDGSVAVQQLDDGGIRALVTMESAAAPSDYRFRLDLPQGAQLQQHGDGSVDVVRDGQSLGRFEAPWAKDANGGAVATSYRIEGDSLVQHVEVTAGTAFPVVADPTWQGVWNRVKAGARKADQQAVLGAIGGCVIGSIGAGAGCGPGAATGAIGGAVKGGLEGFFKGK
ncbi:hypothetical protein [Streptomyces sp. TLI_053]|uniref:hypothetical protein n=1 Tax=Streptomyces sp. TLI_053 TaxID=1855352 RepID=UPI0013520720|nr:hypothetical protein [Streptomyces sp. TLI_053]